MPVDAIVSLLLLIALGAVVYGPWQDLWTDFGRQFLFEARDELFDLAANGELDFNSPEYKTIRSSLETSIRFSHQLTVWRFLVVMKFAQAHDELNKKSAMREAIGKIEKQATREKVDRLVGDASMALLGTMIAKSPIVLIVLILIYAALRLQNGARQKFGRRLEGAVDVIQREAEASDNNWLPRAA